MNGQPQQQQQPPQNRDGMMDEFRAGVTACLRSWSAFRTAVESGWGGIQSLSKAEELRSSIFQYMDGTCYPPRQLTVEDLEDNLAIFMEEEFTVVLEDNSERQIADTIWRMYEQCIKYQDPTLARQMVALGERAIATCATFPVQIQAPEQDDEDDDDEEMQDCDADDTNTAISTGAPQLINMTQQQQSSPPVQPITNMSARDYANQYLFGPPPGATRLAQIQPSGPVRQLGEMQPIPEDSSPIVVDEDGFAPVIKNSRRKAK